MGEEEGEGEGKVEGEEEGEELVAGGEEEEDPQLGSGRTWR